MGNRTGTYFAFDGLGVVDPTKSDFRYYATVQGWDANQRYEFKFVNSHQKASAVRDTSTLATLKTSISQRLAVSKNMVVILSKDTRKSGSMLSWEIEKAVDYYKLPLIIAYTGYNSVMEPKLLKDFWPNSLAVRINNQSARAIHIPFKKDALFEAIGRFTVNGERLGGGLIHYTREAHKQWGYIS